MSAAARSRHHLKQLLFIDLDAINDFNYVSAPRRAYLWTVYFVMHNLRIISFFALDEDWRRSLGDHFEYYSRPRSYWYICGISAFTCCAALHFILIHLMIFKKKAITNLATILHPTFNKSLWASLGLSADDFRRMQMRMQLGVQIVSKMRPMMATMLIVMELYAINKMYTKTSYFSITSLAWAALLAAAGSRCWTALVCYLTIYDTCCVQLQLRLVVVFKQIMESTRNIRANGYFASADRQSCRAATSIVSVLTEVAQLNASARSPILIFMTTMLPCLCTLIFAVFDSRVESIVMRIACALSALQVAITLAYIVYRAAALTMCAMKLYAAINSLFVATQINRNLGITIGNCLLNKVMRQFRRKPQFGLTCGGLFTINMLVFAKVSNPHHFQLQIARFVV